MELRFVHRVLCAACKYGGEITQERAKLQQASQRRRVELGCMRCGAARRARASETADPHTDSGGKDPEPSRAEPRRGGAVVAAVQQRQATRSKAARRCVHAANGRAEPRGSWLWWGSERCDARSERARAFSDSGARSQRHLAGRAERVRNT